MDKIFKFGKKTQGERAKPPSLREKIVDALDMPKEVVLGIVKITITGNKEILIENYKGVLEYTKNVIKISCVPKSIKIAGKNLEIKAITQEMLLISGIIGFFEFINYDN
jgi:sporulation protein YqfC